MNLPKVPDPRLITIRRGGRLTDTDPEWSANAVPRTMAAPTVAWVPLRSSAVGLPTCRCLARHVRILIERVA